MKSVRRGVWHRRQPKELVTTGRRLSWIYEEEDIEVQILAQHGKYLMVRRKGCAPFVATTMSVTEVSEQEGA